MIGESIIIIRRLLTTTTTSKSQVTETVKKLARFLLKSYKLIINNSAKASLFWMIGANIEVVAKMSADALRIGAKEFVNESSTVKLQIINLALLVYVNHRIISAESPPELLKFSQLCFEYILNQAKFDLNVEVRDRARLVMGLFDLYIDVETPQNLLVLEIFKSIERSGFENIQCENINGIGRFSHSMNKQLEGTAQLPPWATSTLFAVERNIIVTNF